MHEQFRHANVRIKITLTELRAVAALDRMRHRMIQRARNQKLFNEAKVIDMKYINENKIHNSLQEHKYGSFQINKCIYYQAHHWPKENDSLLQQ